jgi:hypothetical protein
MRNKFTFLLCTLLFAVFSANAQITGADIGIPEDIFQDLQHVVFTQQYEQCSERAPGGSAIELTKLETKRTVNGVTTTVKEVVIRESKYRKPGVRQNVGVYGLNLVQMFYHDYKYNNVSATDSGYVLVKPSDGWRLNIWEKNGQWYSQQLAPGYGFRLTDPYTKVSRWYSDTELKAMKYFPRGVTKPITVTQAMIIEWSQNYRIGQVRDPNQYVTSILSTVTRVSGNRYKGTIYISGKEVTSGTSLPLITSYGTTGISIGSVKWRLLNGCVPGDGGQMSTTNVMGALYYEYGNFGTCDGSSGPFSPDRLTIDVEAGDSFSYNSNEPDLVTYNGSKNFVLWFNAETQQAAGKNEGTDSYYNVTNSTPRYSLSGN